MPQPTVTTPETDTRWSITPQGRAALDAPSAPTHAFLPEVLHGLTPQEYLHAYLVGWHTETDTCPWWGGPMEVAYEDGWLDHQRDPDRPWATPLFGFQAAVSHTYSLEDYRERVAR